MASFPYRSPAPRPSFQDYARAKRMGAAGPGPIPVGSRSIVPRVLQQAYQAGYQGAHPVSPGAPGGTSLSPGAPPPSASPPMPWDTAYETSVGRINQNLANTNTGLTAQELQAKRGFGLEDASDPYSKAALLQRNYQQARQGTTTTLAARGQLYSGAMSNALNQNRAQYDQSTDALKKEYASVLQGLQQKRLVAQNQASEGIDTAEYNRVARALANRPTTAPPPATPQEATGMMTPYDATGYFRPGRTAGMYLGAPKNQVISPAGVTTQRPLPKPKPKKRR